MFMPRQANMRINQMVAHKLGIPDNKVVHNIERYGNTTAATRSASVTRLGVPPLWGAGSTEPVSPARRRKRLTVALPTPNRSAS